jgi:hypothetical protein
MKCGFVTGTHLLRSITVISLNVMLAISCSTVPPPPPDLRISLEKIDANRRPLGAKLVINGAGFTPGGQATVTISNTSPDGARQAQGAPVSSDGRFSTVFPFQCISFSKKYIDLEMLAKARDNKTGRLTEAAIKAEGFWDCPSS